MSLKTYTYEYDRNHISNSHIKFIVSDCKTNEQVDIYGDIDGQCKRGLKIEYTGKKIFVGTGYLKMLRHELFDKGAQPR